MRPSSTRVKRCDGSIARSSANIAHTVCRDEVAQHVEIGCSALLQPPVHLGNERDRLARHLRLIVDEDGAAAGQEQERVEMVGELHQIERRARLGIDRAWLPYLEAMERAEDDVARRRTRRSA